MYKQCEFYQTILVYLLLFVSWTSQAQVTISGESRQWHKVTFNVTGPMVCEDDTATFLNYRLDIFLTTEDSRETYRVPGFFAGDGKPEDDDANLVSCGNRWQAHFAPPSTGTWNYQVYFRQGKDISLPADTAATGTPLAADGFQGSFQVQNSDKTGRDFRAKGRIVYDPSSNYLKFRGTGKSYIKIGPDSPENLLNYADFDGSYQIKDRSPTKTMQPHLQDWNAYPGSPTWKNGLGKGMIGALNYLAFEAEQNVFSFLTISLPGYNPRFTQILSDDGAVHPFLGEIRGVDTTDKLRHKRFDISKLAQWDIVFAYSDQLGLHKQVKLFETENFSLLTENELRLYFREIIARFGYLLGMEYNICEEIWGTKQNRFPGDDYIQRQKTMLRFLRERLPYPNVPLAIHTRPSQTEYYCEHLEMDSELNIISLQFDYDGVHEKTVQLWKQNPLAGKWVILSDEVGPASWGVPPDNQVEGWNGVYPTDISPTDDAFKTPSQKDIRTYSLWGNLLAGGAGVQYYFGYGGYGDTQGQGQTVDAFVKHSDLSLEDFRTRHEMWKYNKYAHDFFMRYLPFEQMEPHDDLLGISNPLANPCEDGLTSGDEYSNTFYCFAKPGEIYVVCFPNGTDVATPSLQLPAGNYQIHWFNPRSGGNLLTGSKTSVVLNQEDLVNLGDPPTDTFLDWIALVRIDNNGPSSPPTPPNDTTGCNSLPEEWQKQDIGGDADSRACFKDGLIDFSSGEGVLSGDFDVFSFVSQNLDADSIEIITEIHQLSANAEAGIMIRESASPLARYSLLKISQADNRIVQHLAREETGTTPNEIQVRGLEEQLPIRLRLVREGNAIAIFPTQYIFRAYIGNELGGWTEIGSTSFPMTTNALIGLVLIANDGDENASAQFAQTRVRSGQLITSLQEETLSLNNQAIVYPNVTQNQLNLRFPQSVGHVDYTFVDSQGQMHLQGQEDQLDADSELSLDVSSLNQGIYFLRVQTDANNIHVWKVVKQ